MTFEINLSRRWAGIAVTVAAVLVGGMVAYACHPAPSEKPVLQAGQAEGESVVPSGAILTTSVGGLEATDATQEIVSVTGQPFTKALRVTIAKNSPETNATQLTIPNTTPMVKGDVLLAEFYVRGKKANSSPAQMSFLFEKRVNPWTKSVTQMGAAGKDTQAWRHIVVAFAAAESYQPGEAMASLRFAFGPQTVEVGGFTLTNYRKTTTRETLEEKVILSNPLGPVTVTVNRTEQHQVMQGLGGNFAKGRFGVWGADDPVGASLRKNLRIAHARIGLPLITFAPQPGVIKDEGDTHTVFTVAQELHKKGVPLVGSVWGVPDYLVDKPGMEQGGRFKPEQIDAAVELFTKYLVYSRDKYGVTYEYISFNEADYGVNVKLTSVEVADFIRRSGKSLAKAGLKTKWLVGDTSNGTALIPYIKPLLEDETLKPYLGPVAFHCWDALETSEETYRAIAELAAKHGKPVWCLEAGWDSGAWAIQPPTWPTFENAFKLALAYRMAIGPAHSEVVDYWEYQLDYPLTSDDGTKPYPAFYMIQAMEEAFAPGRRIIGTSSSAEELVTIASADKAGKARLLLINSAGTAQVTIANLKAKTITTFTRQDTNPDTKLADNSKAISVPARSVVLLEE